MQVSRGQSKLRMRIWSAEFVDVAVLAHILVCRHALVAVRDIRAAYPWTTTRALALTLIRLADEMVSRGDPSIQGYLLLLLRLDGALLTRLARLPRGLAAESEQYCGTPLIGGVPRRGQRNVQCLYKQTALQYKLWATWSVDRHLSHGVSIVSEATRSMWQ
jgi:hypothetical protein